MSRKTFRTTVVSTFADELISDLEEAAHDCALIEPLPSNSAAYLAAYENLSRHRRLLYTYLSELEHYVAGHSPVVEAHLQHPTHKRF